MSNAINLIGKKFGRLLVIFRAPNDKRGEARWKCKCDCGNVVTVLSSHIRSGRIKSCGCFIKDNKNKIMQENRINLEDYNRLYHIYNSLMQRCNNKNHKNYKNYGRRGIKVCEEWLRGNNGFNNFCKWAIKNGYKNNLTIDRINVNKNYEPSNCRWITIKEQENNRRNNIFVEYNGKKRTLKQWSDELHIPYGTVYGRYLRKLSIEDILSLKDLRSKNESNK